LLPIAWQNDKGKLRRMNIEEPTGTCWTEKNVGSRQFAIDLYPQLQYYTDCTIIVKRGTI